MTHEEFSALKVGDRVSVTITGTITRKSALGKGEPFAFVKADDRAAQLTAWAGVITPISMHAWAGRGVTGLNTGEAEARESNSAA